MENDILKVLFTEEQIRARIQELGEELTRDYQDKDPVIVGVLKGVVVFYADMIRQIKVPCQMDFMWISSYAGTTSTGTMEVKRDISSDIQGRHVLILEDIYDTGNSLDSAFQEPRFLKNLHLPGQARAPEARHHPEAGLCGLPGAQRICGGLWPGLQRTLPEPSVYRRFEAGSIRRITEK